MRKAPPRLNFAALRGLTQKVTDPFKEVITLTKQKIRKIRPYLIGLLFILIFSFAFCVTAFSAEVVNIPAGTPAFHVDLTFNVPDSFAGVQFEMESDANSTLRITKVEPLGISPDSIYFSNDLRGGKREYIFGFTHSTNNFSGSITVRVHFSASGNEPQTASFTAMKIIRQTGTGGIPVVDTSMDPPVRTINVAGQIVTNVPVTSINVTSPSNTITTNGGTLQMTAIVLPANATDKSVTWSVINGTGTASISTGGLLTAATNGTVTVKATANDGSSVTGERIITISGQTPDPPPEVPITSISIRGESNSSAITVNNGTLLIIATVTPSNTTEGITWSITQGTGSGKLEVESNSDRRALLTAQTNGTVTITAESKSVKSEPLIINISGQNVDNPRTGGPSGTRTIAEVVTPLAAVSSFSPFIEGFEDGTFRGSQQITREQFVTILARLKNTTVPIANADNPSFGDVQPNRWSFNAIEWAKAAGIVEANAEGNFRPAEPLTRAEMAVMLVRAENLTEAAANNFSDLAGHSAATDILRAVHVGIFTGYEDGTFRPDGNSTRYEAVTALVRYLLKGEPEPGMWQNITLKFSDVAQSHWAYKYVAIAVSGYTVP